MKGISIRLAVWSAAFAILFGIEARGAVTNYLDGVKDFRELVERVEGRSPHSIKRNKDGAVEYIGEMYMSDDAIELISREPSVRALGCIWPTFTERGMNILGQMTNLTSLTIVRSNALPTVSKLTQLRKLNLMCTRLKPADLPCLIKLTNLEDLDIRGAWAMGTNSLSAMTNLTHLKRLIIGGGGDSNSRARTIANFRTNGYEIGTNWDGWRNPETSELTALTNLTSLNELQIIYFNDFGDEHLRKLASIPNLKSLYLDATGVSKNWSNILSRFSSLTNAAVDVLNDNGIETQKWVRNSGGR